MSVLIILVLATLIIVIHQKNKRIKAEVAELQKRVDEHKDNPENDTYLSAQKVILKSKAVLNCQDIIYVKSDGHYVEYYLKDKNKPEVDRNTMAEVLNELPERAFIRIHRSYIVNIQSIKIINSKRVMLDNGEWINLSRTFKPDLYKALNKA